MYISYKCFVDYIFEVFLHVPAQCTPYKTFTSMSGHTYPGIRWFILVMENGVGGKNIVCEVCYPDWRCDGYEHDFKRN